MKKKFAPERIKEFNCAINKDDNFQLYHILPTKKSDILIFFIPGLNGNGVTIEYWNYMMFDQYHLITFDARAQAGNKNKPYRSYKKYLKDIHEIIKQLKEQFHFKKIYLIGESWGAALATLYCSKYQDVDGFFIWNMPCKIINTSKVKGIEKIKRDLKMLLTYLFSINTYDESPFVNELTNDKLLIRAINVFRNKKVSNKVIIASWKSFKPAWKCLLKKYNSLNFEYIQSNEDIMIDKEKTNQLKQLTNKIKFFDQGYHILSFDVNVEDKLFDEMHQFIIKNK